MTILTRSGGNQFHGSAFEYYRGGVWQASNPFNPGVKQPFERNQFGGSVGGPIAHHRTFFFGNYEGNRQTQSAPIIGANPPDAFWNGDFSSLLASKSTLRDPLNSGAIFPGNVIPASRISPVALALRLYYGSPTSAGLSNNFIRDSTNANNADQFTIRLDQPLPRNQNLSLRFTQANSNAITRSITADASGLISFTKRTMRAWDGRPFVPVKEALHFDAERAAADLPLIHVFREGSKPAETVQPDANGSWVTCSPETVESFSATLFFRSRDYTTLQACPWPDQLSGRRDGH